MIDEPEPTAVWLIDNAYLIMRGKHEKLWVDILSTMICLERKFGEPLKTFLFNSYFTDNHYPHRMEQFYRLMENNKVEIRLHPMVERDNGATSQRRVDVDIGAHVVWLGGLPSVKTVILTTGDQDMVPAVELVQREFDVHVALLSFNCSVNRDLISASSSHLLFEDNPDTIR